MAAEDSKITEFEKQELDDTISCCICTNVYIDPKALPCIHTFCMKCLQETGLSTNKGPGDEMPCPICRRQFRIPQEGFLALPNNFFIAKLIQVANVLNPSSSSTPLCDACLEDNEKKGKETPTADMYCTDCKQKLCEECCRHHRKLKLTKNHKLMPINERQESDENVMANLALSVCEFHEQRVLEIYCAECKTVECAVCFIDGHKHHEGSHVSKFVDDFRKQIEKNNETINHCSSQTQVKKDELVKIKEDMQQKVERLEMDVLNRRDELKQFVDTQANSLLQSLCSIRQSKLKEIEMEEGDIDSQLSCLQSYSSYCQKIMAKGSASDICRAFLDLSIRAMELQQQCQSQIEREFRSFKFCFTKSEFEKFWEDKNLIGVIEEEFYSRQEKASITERTTAEELRLELDTEKMKNRTLQDNIDKLVQELECQKSTSKTLQVENMNLRQELDTERNAMEALLKSKEPAIEDCEKTKTAKRELLPLPGFIETTTTEPDMLDLDDESPVRAKMPCGHVIGPLSMTEYCRILLKEGKCRFYCPSSSCNREWEYFLVRHVARLTEEEMHEFERKISENYLKKASEMQRCPGCQIWCFRAPGTGNCVRCSMCTKSSGNGSIFVGGV